MEYQEVNDEILKAAPPTSVAALHFAGITLSDAVLYLTLLYLALQVYFLLRDKWWRDRKKDDDDDFT
jgi:hypothetical protein